jgi:two-component system alkaline phosphatase synthesis response regulator PhoP
MKKKKILVIDDEPAVAGVIKEILQYEGYKVIVEHKGGDGLARVKKSRPDMIILDIILPDIDGYLVCEQLKSDSETKGIPIIMLTGKDMGEDFEKAMEKNADWYIVKPFDNEHLLRTIKNLFTQKERQNI